MAWTLAEHVGARPTRFVSSGQGKQRGAGRLPKAFLSFLLPLLLVSSRPRPRSPSPLSSEDSLVLVDEANKSEGDPLQTSHQVKLQRIEAWRHQLLALITGEDNAHQHWSWKSPASWWCDDAARPTLGLNQIHRGWLSAIQVRPRLRITSGGAFSTMVPTTSATTARTCVWLQQHIVYVSRASFGTDVKAQRADKRRLQCAR